jgi:hypothetical protein
MTGTASKPRGLASIIIPCWNQLEFTRHCIAALMRCTRSPWELIVVNNGSTDGTSGYLAGEKSRWESGWDRQSRLYVPTPIR